MVWNINDPCGNEAGKIKYEIVQYTRGKGIDLGCGPEKAFPHFIGVDSCKDTELFNIEMKPDVVCDDASNLDFLDNESLDFIFSSHLLEHIVDTKAALAEWWSKIKTGGHLVLYYPDPNEYPNIGQPGANPDHKHDLQPEVVIAMMKEIGSWDLLVNERRNGGTEYSILQVFKKRDDGLQLVSLPSRPEKSACIIRYGGFGDSIQASGILPELKRKGYFVTFMTTPRGQEILKHDPHIDAWMLQDDDQVPNHDLPLYWMAMAKRFDKFVNLSESVEGTLLAFPGRANHTWPASVRRSVMGKNYLEWTAQLAELDYFSEAKFYPSNDERSHARKYLAGIKNDLAGVLTIPQRAPERFNILWCLAGSSIHKFYPHQDTVIARVMEELPDAVVIFNGDYPCKLLEQGWEKEPRIRCESGNMGIRETLTLALHADCVIGPETGVLNAVAFEPMTKVIFLSHSSPENLTKHWSNTETLTPKNTDCYPCHRLHYGKEFCSEDAETGAALCQKNISPDRVFDAIRKSYVDWKELRQRMAA